jgi:hypothetical protein
MTILSKIWEEWTLIWTIHNQVIHGHNHTSRLNIQRLEAETELRAIYEDRELLLPADQDHLFDDVNTHLAYSTNSIRNWLNTYQGLFTDSISKAKKRALDGNLFYSKLFPTCLKRKLHGPAHSRVPGAWVDCSQ